MINPIIGGRKFLMDIKNINSEISNMHKIELYSGSFTFSNDGFCTIIYEDIGVTNNPKSIIVNDIYGDQTVKFNFYTVQRYGPKLAYIYGRKYVISSDQTNFPELLKGDIYLDLVFIY